MVSELLTRPRVSELPRPANPTSSALSPHASHRSHVSHRPFGPFGPCPSTLSRLSTASTKFIHTSNKPRPISRTNRSQTTRIIQSLPSSPHLMGSTNAVSRQPTASLTGGGGRIQAFTPVRRRLRLRMMKYNSLPDWKPFGYLAIWQDIRVCIILVVRPHN